MPRPSVKDQRSAQILDAFEICVARYGVEGATLERIAEEAGLARALIRHNVGNKDDLLDALTKRFFERSDQSMKKLIDMLPTKDRSETMVDWLMEPGAGDAQSVLVSEALIAAGANDPTLARRMRKWTRDFIEDIASVLREDYPKADEQSISAVAAGITGIYFNVESTTPLGPMSDVIEASRLAAHRLLQSLEV